MTEPIAPTAGAMYVGAAFNGLASGTLRSCSAPSPATTKTRRVTGSRSFPAATTSTFATNHLSSSEPGCSSPMDAPEGSGRRSTVRSVTERNCPTAFGSSAQAPNGTPRAYRRPFSELTVWQVACGDGSPYTKGSSDLWPRPNQRSTSCADQEPARPFPPMSSTRWNCAGRSASPSTFSLSMRAVGRRRLTRLYGMHCNRVCPPRVAIRPAGRDCSAPNAARYLTEVPIARTVRQPNRGFGDLSLRRSGPDDRSARRASGPSGERFTRPGSGVPGGFASHRDEGRIFLDDLSGDPSVIEVLARHGVFAPRGVESHRTVRVPRPAAASDGPGDRAGAPTMG